ncbi:MAG TPA: cytochrome c [Stellaceae bacterium]|jgi:cytochrome c556|nr:cytochrome c [Stellaceae bacterium]
MRSVKIIFALGAALVVLAGLGTAQAQDAMKIVQGRQAAMKQQGKDLGAVKAFLDGKGDLAGAQAGSTDLVERVGQITNLFPPKTGMEEFPGKSGAKPAIWTEWDKFTAAQKNALAKAQILETAVKGGDKATIEAAFGDMGKNGCGGCHTPYREKI